MPASTSVLMHTCTRACVQKYISLNVFASQFKPQNTYAIILLTVAPIAWNVLRLLCGYHPPPPPMVC